MRVCYSVKIKTNNNPILSCPPFFMGFVIHDLKLKLFAPLSQNTFNFIFYSSIFNDTINYIFFS